MEDPIYQQMTLWGDIYEKKLIKKPVRVIEFFAGIGSQLKSIEILAKNNPNIKYESWKICEWPIPSIISYDVIHNGEPTITELGQEELVDKLFKLGVSNDSSTPCSKTQLKRMSNTKLNQVWSAIQRTHNLVNIMNVKGGFRNYRY